MAQERKTFGRDAAGGPIPLELPPDRAFVLHLDTRARPPPRVVGRIEHVTPAQIAHVGVPSDTRSLSSRDRVFADRANPGRYAAARHTKGETVMSFRNREGITLRTATAALALAAALAAAPATAAFLSGTNGDDVIVGADDDNVDNPVVQPEGAVNQSLDNADAIDGRDGDDVLIGLLGSDTIRGGRGNDVIIGGTEQGSLPNSDIMFGDDGNDVNLWRGGDGSEAFIGGRGLDALVFGNIDRDASNIPILSPATGRHAKTGLPSADVTGQGAFCKLEDVRSQGLGYEFLIRFIIRATGNLAVTVRTADVEQIFCTSVAGGAITFADLTAPNPDFVEVSLDEVAKLNRLVRQIIR